MCDFGQVTALLAQPLVPPSIKGRVWTKPGPGTSIVQVNSEL